MRDMQQSRLYAAEDAVRKSLGTPRLDRIAMLAFVERVERSHWFQRTFRIYRIAVVKPHWGQRRSLAFGTRTISIVTSQRDPIIILHEIAHLCTDRNHREHASHGWEYAAIYLRLVRHFLGVEVHDRLRASFKQHRVRYTKPRQSRPLTEAEKQILRDRLASYRAAKVTHPKSA